MLSHFSKVLFTLLLTVLFAFVWALILFYTNASIRPENVDWSQVLRDLSLCLAAFLLFATAAYLPVRPAVATKLMLGFGLHFFGVWQHLLNDVIQPTGWLPQIVRLAFIPLGLLIATLGLYQMGRAYRVNRLMLGSYQKIERDLATVDQLTQLYNRRYFFTTCGRHMDRLASDDTPPAGIGFRIINLTELNQKLGFHAGDEALIRVGKAIRRYLRPGQIAARMGGRRFAIYMPDGTREEAESFIAQLSQRLKHVLLKDIHGEEVLVSIELHTQIAVAGPGETLEALSQRISAPLDEESSPGR